MIYLIFNIILCFIYPYLLKVIVPKEKLKITYFIITFIQLVILHSFIKVDGWVDLPNYERQFFHISTLSIKQFLFSSYSTELLFYFLMKISSLISTEFVFFLIINSVLTLICYYITINRYSPNYVMSLLFILVTVYNPSLTVLRQGLALALVTLTYMPIIERKFIPFVLIMITVFLIHQTSIVFFPMYFLYGIRNKKIYFLSIIIGALVVGLTFGSLSKFFAIQVFDKYSLYVQGYGIKINSTRFFIILSVLLAYVFIMRKDYLKDGINKLLFTLLLLGTISSLVGIGVVQSDRLFLYYTTCIFLAIPVMYSRIKQTSNKVIFALVTFGAFAFVALYNNHYLSELKYLF